MSDEVFVIFFLTKSLQLGAYQVFVINQIFGRLGRGFQVFFYSSSALIAALRATWGFLVLFYSSLDLTSAFWAAGKELPSLLL